MSKTYDKCGPEVTSLLTEIIATHHATILAAGVTFNCLFVSDEKNDEPVPALKRHGVPCAAETSLTSLADRIRGIPDVKILIDRDTWKHLSQKGRKALLDHEVTHVEMKGEGEPDDAGRPKLKLRMHDWEVWGFAEIASRYGKAALEVQAIHHVRQEWGQLLLWPEDGDASAASHNGHKSDEPEPIDGGGQ